MQWEIFVPGSLGPWTEVSIAASGEGYEVEEVSVLVDGESTPADVSTDGPSVSASTGEQAPVGGWLSFLYKASRLTDAKEFTTDAILTITTPDQVKLVRRAVLTYEFSSTITIPDDAPGISSSSSGASSAPSSSSSSGADESTTTIWGTSVVSTTIHGTVTEYTTYCPISTETHSKSTVTVSVESCPGVTVCHVGTSTAPGGEEHTFTYTESIATITKCPGGCEAKETTSIPGAPVTTITLGHGSQGPVTTGGAAHTTTNAEGSTVVVVYKTSATSPGSGAAPSLSTVEGGSSAPPGVTTFQGAANKLASGLGLLLPAFVFLF